MKPIPDHIIDGLKVLFVGFNPSIRSSETGHHFANPNNRFWTILYQSNLTPRKFQSEEDKELLELGYGLTNIVARPTKEAAEITKEEYEQGRITLLKKINTYKPVIVCFVGKGVYLQYSKKRKASWGVQPDSISSSIEFVAPSSSGLVRMKMTEIVGIYQELHKFIDRN
ncbi:G/U mismatch-specific DNA glycosylase [Aquibacillus albus]|uniref:G/U mismatch-specific DNA glycosylase n=1 Tax=Aquibacillus albus TaxID=1168171 RepID=UPI00195992B9|nr:G/U mismatch-specific DNA glycosylase [Aquibacillus albus]